MKIISIWDYELPLSPPDEKPLACPRCGNPTELDLCADCDNELVICNTCGKPEWPERITNGQCQYCYENGIVPAI